MLYSRSLLVICCKYSVCTSNPCILDWGQQRPWETHWLHICLISDCKSLNIGIYVTFVFLFFSSPSSFTMCSALAEWKRLPICGRDCCVYPTHILPFYLSAVNLSFIQGSQHPAHSPSLSVPYGGWALLSAPDDTALCLPLRTWGWHTALLSPALGWHPSPCN